MLSLNIRVPDLPTAYKFGSEDYSKPSTIQANIRLLQQINSTYKTPINLWAETFNIPPSVIISFIATESGGRMLPPNKYKATGLMQLTPDTLWEAVKKWGVWVKSSPIPTNAASLLKSKIPVILTSKAIRPDPLTTDQILKALQNDANFNTMAGTLVLRWLIERFSTSITGGQLNKAMVAYNASAYTKALVEGAAKNPIKAPIDTLVLATNRIVPLESRNYLYKMLGQDGYLALILQRNALGKK
jgi:soluble lytic murein transglycosylase-like protein